MGDVVHFNSAGGTLETFKNESVLLLQHSAILGSEIVWSTFVPVLESVH